MQSHQADLIETGSGVSKLMHAIKTILPDITARELQAVCAIAEAAMKIVRLGRRADSLRPALCVRHSLYSAAAPQRNLAATSIALAMSRPSHPR
jgi:hypothetical protein